MCSRVRPLRPGVSPPPPKTSCASAGCAAWVYMGQIHVPAARVRRSILHTTPARPRQTPSSATGEERTRQQEKGFKTPRHTAPSIAATAASDPRCRRCQGPPLRSLPGSPAAVAATGRERGRQQEKTCPEGRFKKPRPHRPPGGCHRSGGLWLPSLPETPAAVAATGEERTRQQEKGFKHPRHTAPSIAATAASDSPCQLSDGLVLLFVNDEQRFRV